MSGGLVYLAIGQGDIIFKYKPSQIEWLKYKGYLKKLEDIEEF